MFRASHPRSLGELPPPGKKSGPFEDKELLGGKRPYITDFEVYGAHLTDPQNLQADLYVGLKPADDHGNK